MHGMMHDTTHVLLGQNMSRIIGMSYGAELDSTFCNSHGRMALCNFCPIICFIRRMSILTILVPNPARDAHLLLNLHPDYYFRRAEICCAPGTYRKAVSAHTETRT